MKRKLVSADGQELKRLYEQHALAAMQASARLRSSARPMPSSIANGDRGDGGNEYDDDDR
jgi:hypothetical protein